jgi:hypothetical protein
MLPKSRTMISVERLPEIADISRSHASAAAAVHHAITLLEATLAHGKQSIHSGDIFLALRRDLPYVLQPMEKSELRILVNRQYKPVGCNLPDGQKWVRYEDYPNLHFHLTETQIANVVCPPYQSGLFGDGCPPWYEREDAVAYLERLRKLYELLRQKEFSTTGGEE